MTALVRILAFSCLAAGAAAQVAAQTVAITGGKVFPVSGPPIERATVIVTEGRSPPSAPTWACRRVRA